jgi:1-acyl-sn-glycerol-3-phosphate acyltransferase
MPHVLERPICQRPSRRFQSLEPLGGNTGRTQISDCGSGRTGETRKLSNRRKIGNVGDSEIHDLFDILTEMNSRYSLHDGFWASARGSLCFERFCRAFFKWYCPLTVEERHHLSAAPFLLCSNHTRHADSAVLMTASGRSFCSFALIGASDYFFRSRRLSWAVSPLMNVIPIDREPGAKSLSACLATCREFMQQTGGSPILYPEGTRSQDGKVRAFKNGAALFAIELDVPVVPAYIEGTLHILPKGHYVPRAGPVTGRFGEPVELARLQSGELPRERRLRAVEQLTQRVRMLKPTPRRCRS